MSLARLASKYISSAERVLSEAEVAENPLVLYPDALCKVMESARDYLQDAKYYRDKGRFDVSLASIAYCEGLLDALRLLGAARFEWPSGGRRRRGEE